MQPRIDLITLGVPDLAAARRFYVEGLGWEPTFEVPGEVVFLQVGHSRLLALWGADALEADIAGTASVPASPRPPRMSLAQIVSSEDEVVQILDRAAAAGGSILKEPQYADFGGYQGYFADPAGFRWEIATNPGWSVAEDGTVSLGPIGEAGAGSAPAP